VLSNSTKFLPRNNHNVISHHCSAAVTIKVSALSAYNIYYRYITHVVINSGNGVIIYAHTASNKGKKLPNDIDGPKLAVTDDDPYQCTSHVVSQCYDR
jgi:hypothetical protein